MKFSIFTTLVAVASSITAVAASYSETCENCKLEERDSDWLSGDDHAPILICNCGDGQGGAPETKLDLNSCLMNSHGNILPRLDGNFGSTCNMFELDGTSIGGHCET